MAIGPWLLVPQVHRIRCLRVLPNLRVRVTTCDFDIALAHIGKLSSEIRIIHEATHSFVMRLFYAKNVVCSTTIILDTKTLPSLYDFVEIVELAGQAS